MFYEIGHYQIRIPKEDKYAFKNNNNSRYTNLDEEGSEMLAFCNITIKNKNTGEGSKK